MSGNHCALTTELQLQIQTLPKITTINKPPCPDNEIIRQQQKKHHHQHQHNHRHGQSNIIIFLCRRAKDGERQSPGCQWRRRWERINIIIVMTNHNYHHQKDNGQSNKKTWVSIEAAVGTQRSKVELLAVRNRPHVRHLRNRT